MLRNIFSKSSSKTLLGRWNLSCDRSTAIKVNWANVDHCGTCSKEELNIKYVDCNTSPIIEPKLEEVFYCADAFYEVVNVQNSLFNKEKKKQYNQGLDYFLTRYKL
jgi:hypothetical protein